MLTAFTASLLLITACELGDKSFFIAAILAMRHSPRLILAGSLAALALMTVLAAVLGSMLNYFPSNFTRYGAIALLVFFGVNALWQAWQTPPGECGEIEAAVAEVEKDQSLNSQTKWTPLAIIIKAFTLTFLAEWGDRTQIATITLAAAHPPIGVITGAIVGHTASTGIAVIGGRLLADRISERTMSAIGGILFLIFAVTTWLEAN